MGDDFGGPPPPEAPLMWLRVADALFRELDVAGTHAPFLLVKVPELPAWSASRLPGRRVARCLCRFKIRRTWVR